MRRAPLATVAALLAALAVPAWAAAHVDVLPTTVVQGEAAEFTIRVPNERDIPNTAVRVDFPPQVTVYALSDPPPGWRVTPRTAPDGRLAGVTLQGRLAAGRYLDYTVLGTPFDAGTATWRSFQTYADGRVKPWTTDGAAEEGESGPTTPGPAAVTEILPEGSAVPVPGAAAAGDDGGDGSDAGIWLGVIAIGFGALALLATGFLWTTRPMSLPEDDRA